MQLRISHCNTPVGLIALALRGSSLCALGFIEQWPSLLGRLERRFGPLSLREEPDPEGLTGLLSAYLGGAPGALDGANCGCGIGSACTCGIGVDLDPGGTPFQRRVWAALRAIPSGSTISYSEIAERIGAPRAVRAVGTANGANPISIVIPCHRVIGRAGELRGYAGGLHRKRWLLALEGASPQIHQSIVPPTPSPCAPSMTMNWER